MSQFNPIEIPPPEFPEISATPIVSPQGQLPSFGQIGTGAASAFYDNIVTTWASASNMLGNIQKIANTKVDYLEKKATEETKMKTTAEMLDLAWAKHLAEVNTLHNSRQDVIASEAANISTQVGTDITTLGTDLSIDPDVIDIIDAIDAGHTADELAAEIAAAELAAAADAGITTEPPTGYEALVEKDRVLIEQMAGDRREKDRQFFMGEMNENESLNYLIEREDHSYLIQIGGKGDNDRLPPDDLELVLRDYSVSFTINQETDTRRDGIRQLHLDMLGMGPEETEARALSGQIEEELAQALSEVMYLSNTRFPLEADERERIRRIEELNDLSYVLTKEHHEAELEVYRAAHSMAAQERDLALVENDPAYQRDIQAMEASMARRRLLLIEEEYAETEPQPEGTPTVGEEDFQGWYRDWAEKLDLNEDPDDPLHQYDYRAAYQAGAVPTQGEDGEWHWPSKHKMEGHPNLIVDGVNTKTGETVGEEEQVTKAISPVLQSVVEWIESEESETVPDVPVPAKSEDLGPFSQDTITKNYGGLATPKDIGSYLDAVMSGDHLTFDSAMKSLIQNEEVLVDENFKYEMMIRLAKLHVSKLGQPWSEEEFGQRIDLGGIKSLDYVPEDATMELMDGWRGMMHQRILKTIWRKINEGAKP
jgi:hypothetical protein